LSQISDVTHQPILYFNQSYISSWNVYFKTSRGVIWVLPLFIFTVICFRDFYYSVLKRQNSGTVRLLPNTRLCICTWAHKFPCMGHQR